MSKASYVVIKMKDSKSSMSSYKLWEENELYFWLLPSDLSHKNNEGQFSCVRPRNNLEEGYKVGNPDSPVQLYLRLLTSKHKDKFTAGGLDLQYCGLRGNLLYYLPVTGH